MPARSKSAPRVEGALKDETNGIQRPIAEQTMGPQDPPARLLEQDRSRKTSVTREMPDGGAVKPRQHSLVLPLIAEGAGRPDNSSLHDVKAGNKCRRKSENRVQTLAKMLASFLVLDSGF
jgi:hypothetical protein